MAPVPRNDKNIQKSFALRQLFHVFQKKTQKTPKKEIEKAIKIKNEYESEK